MSRIALSNRIVAIVWTILLSYSTLMLAQAGSLDPTFGKNGIVTTPNTTTGCGGNVNCTLVIQTDGKIVVGGGASSGGISELALARYTTKGTLDSTFGSGGIVTYNNGKGVGPAFGLALQTDGKLVAASTIGLNLAVFRFNTNGTLDTTFGTGGIVQTTAAGRLFAPVIGGLGLLADGRIVVGTGPVMIRLLTDGAFDTSFGTNGVASLLGAPQTLAVLSNEQVLVASSFTFTIGAATRYNSNGGLDTTFGVVGQAPGFGGPLAILPLSNGKLLVGGTLDSAAPPSGGTTPQGFIVTRYNSNGTVDGSFGTRGATVTAFPGEGYSAALALAAQSDGDIVAVGVTEAQNPVFGPEPSDFALIRYTPTGQLDSSFGNGGLVTTAFGGNAAAASAVAIQSDGKIVVAGNDNSLTGGPNNGFTLARYLAQ